LQTHKKEDKKTKIKKFTDLKTMALARLALRNLQQKLSPSLMGQSCERGLVGNRHNPMKLNRFMATSAGEQEDKMNTEVSVSEKKSPRQNFPRRRGRKSLWRNTDDHGYFTPTLNGTFVILVHY